MSQVSVRRVWAVQALPVLAAHCAQVRSGAWITKYHPHGRECTEQTESFFQIKVITKRI